MVSSGCAIAERSREVTEEAWMLMLGDEGRDKNEVTRLQNATLK